MGTERQEYGQSSESLVVARLKKMGYEILERNLRAKTGEIDIIAKDGETIVFVEVKARRSKSYNPKAAVTRSKQRKISMTALLYLKKSGQAKVKARFDVAAIGSKRSPGGVEIVKNAFELAYR